MGALQKVMEGVMINSLSNVRLSMVEQPKSLLLADEAGVLVEAEVGKEFRVQGIANWALGRDEKVLITGQALEGVSPADPHFTRVKDLEMCDIIIDALAIPAEAQKSINDGSHLDGLGNATAESAWGDLENLIAGLFSGGLGDSVAIERNKDQTTTDATLTRHTIPAILPTGVGAAPLPSSMDNLDPSTLASGELPFRKIFFLDDTLCDHTLPATVAKNNNILVIKRGDCSFNDKLGNIPSFAPDATSLQLVVVLSVPEAEPEGHIGELIRPLLDKVQLTPSGLERRHPIAMVMVDGSTDSAGMFRRAASSIASFDARGKLKQESRSSELEHGAPGLGVKRRYWYESMGVPIGNLIVV